MYLAKAGLATTLNLANFIMVFGVLIVFEIMHWRTLGQEDSFTKVQKSMTIKEFEDAVAAGSKYVIVDECVLDVEPFIVFHPGSKFALVHNIGMDVSKFFHGGYSLEGNLGGRPAQGHKHSNYARKIVNQLIIAQIDKQVIVQSTMCKVKRTNKVNETTAVLELHSIDGKPIPNFRRFFAGTAMLGKHFTVKGITGNRTTRHYTICNVMEPNVYAELVKHLKVNTAGKGTGGDPANFSLNEEGEDRSESEQYQPVV